MPKAILKRRLNFMTELSGKGQICGVPKGLTVCILKRDGHLAFIFWKGYAKWVNEKHFLKPTKER